ncbi:hypothetical protein [Alishewanella longhuensis]
MEFIMLLLVLLVVVIALVASRFIDNSNPFQVQRKASLFSPVTLLLRFIGKSSAK